MEIEITQHVGAERYERGAERTGERNGYRDRTWDTRVGSIELRVPRVRDGGYYPALLEPGIASALTSRLVDDALERGVRTVFLSAFHPSIYERLGFCRIGSALIAVGGHEEVLPSGGRFRLTAAAQVRGDCVVSRGGQSRQLAAPGVPDIGKAVEEEDCWTLASFGHVHVDVVDVDGAVGDVGHGGSRPGYSY